MKMESLEHVIQSWWLASTRINDCAGDTLTMGIVEDALEALRLNQWSGRVRHLADEELRQLAARRFSQRGAVG